MLLSNVCRISRSALAVATILVACSTVLQAAKKKVDFFTPEELTPDVALCGTQFYLPNVFGPTGMNGWILEENLVVREVEPGSPADGIALVNDMILKANGLPLGENPLKTLGEQIEPSEASGKLKLTVSRDGKVQDIVIPLRKLGPMSPNWPYDCAKSRNIHLDACQYLGNIQNNDGSFDGKIYVGFGLNGLTWLAADDPKYWENARRLAYSYEDSFNPEDTSTSNWGWAYMAVFLAEYYQQTGDHTVLPQLQKICQSLSQTQTNCGSWGHGAYPGAGYVQGGNLNNCGLVCWMALVLADECGVEVDQQSLAKATNFFSRFPHRGTVPYGDHRPEFGGGNGKNAIPGVCYRLMGQQDNAEYFARCVTSSYTGRTGGHTGGYMGFIWGNIIGTENPHYPDYRRMLDHWKWLQHVSRRWDGGFLLPESIIGKIYTYRGPVLSTGGMAQVYAMPGKVLRIHGGPKSVFAQKDLSPELQKGIQFFRHRKFDELRQLIKPTTPEAKQLLAVAAKVEKDIALTKEKVEDLMANGDIPLAAKIWAQTDRYTGGMDPDRGGFNWRIRTAKGAGPQQAAADAYERYRLLTYSWPDAREAFERLAQNPKAGVYQQKARDELATPIGASKWTFYGELLWKDYSPTWAIDDRARAAVIRAADIPSGNWTKISALKVLHSAGILGERLKDWVPLVPPCTEGFPGKKPTWKMLSVSRSKGETPPEGWKEIDFDDSSWDSGIGPIGGRGRPGLAPNPGCVPYVRIPFNCDDTNLKTMILLVRLMKDNRCVVFLNGMPIFWSDPTQGGRMWMEAMTTTPLSDGAIKLLRKGKNVLAIRFYNSGVADVAIYANAGSSKMAPLPRPADWVIKPELRTPDLVAKTASYPPKTTVLPPCTTGLKFDPPGKPNVDSHTYIMDFVGPKDGEPLGNTPMEERAKYFGHFVPGVRRAAAYSLMAEGQKAMPHIIKGLQSDDVRVLRAACDAMGGPYAMNGRGGGDLRKAMTPEISNQAIPYLLPLLKHDDIYVLEGALMALANCGDLTPEQYDEVNKLADHSDWWVRAGVAHVLGYVKDEDSQGKATACINSFLAEESTFGRNRLREAMVNMAKRGHNLEAIVDALIAEAETHPGPAMGALSNIGAPAKKSIFLFEKRMADQKAKLATFDPDNPDDKGHIKAYTKYLGGTMSTLQKMDPEKYPRPKAPPKKRRN